jgi:hypothetical protein
MLKLYVDEILKVNVKIQNSDRMAVRAQLTS